MTADPPYETRSSRSTLHPNIQQDFGLRSRSSGNASAAEPSNRRGSYYWHGQYYEIDENTQQEWIDAGRKDRRKSAATSPAPSPAPETTAQQVCDTCDYLLDRMPPAPTASMAASAEPSLMVTLRLPTATLARFKAKGLSKSFFDLSDEMRIRVYRLASPTGKIIELEHDAPLIRTEPVAALLNRRIRNECLPLFYAENEFRCPFHGTLYKFLNNLDLVRLRALRSVRLTTPLGHSGFVTVLFEKLLERRKDGLRVGAVQIALSIGDEGQLWVTQSDLDELEGTSGRWDGSGVVKRKVPISEPPQNRTEADAASTDQNQGAAIAEMEILSPSREPSPSLPLSPTPRLPNLVASTPRKLREDSQEETPEPSPSASGHVAEQRRPTSTNSYYSHRILATDELWDDMSHKYRLTLSHVGRIEEGWGEMAAVPCDQCIENAQNGYVCMVYTAKSQADLERSSANSRRSGACSRCRYHNRKCNLVKGRDGVEARAESEAEEAEEAEEPEEVVQLSRRASTKRIVYDSDDE